MCINQGVSFLQIITQQDLIVCHTNIFEKLLPQKERLYAGTRITIELEHQINRHCVILTIAHGLFVLFWFAAI